MDTTTVNKHLNYESTLVPHWVLTVVIRTPKLSAGGTGVGAAGVSINSKSSNGSDADFDIVIPQLDD